MYFALGEIVPKDPKNPNSEMEIDYIDRLLAPLFLPGKVPDSILHTRYQNLYINDVEVDVSNVVSPGISNIEQAYMIPYWEVDNTETDSVYPLTNLQTYIPTDYWFVSDPNTFDPTSNTKVKEVNSPYLHNDRPFGVEIVDDATVILHNQGLPVLVTLLYKEKEPAND